LVTSPTGGVASTHNYLMKAKRCRGHMELEKKSPQYQKRKYVIYIIRGTGDVMSSKGISGQGTGGAATSCGAVVLARMKGDNNDREVVGRIAAEGKVEKGARSLLRVFDVPYFINRVLIFANIPKLRIRLDQKKAGHASFKRSTLTPSQARMRNSSSSPSVVSVV
jgi:hypothetical protein